MDEETRMAYLNGLRTLTQNANYEKAGTEELHIGGGNKKCTKTTIILNDRNVKNGIGQLIDALKNDNRIKLWKNNTEVFAVNGEYTLGEFEAALDELCYTINDMIDVVRFDIYTNKGKLVKVDLTLTLDLHYGEDTLTITAEFFGDKSPLDDFKFEYVAGKREETKIVVSSKGNHSGHGKQFNAETTVQLYEYGYETMKLNSVSEIDLSKAKDNFKYNLVFASEDGNINLLTEGDFTTSSTKINYDLHNVFLTVQDHYYGDRLSIDGNLRLGWERGGKDILTLGDTNKLQVLNLTEHDWYATMSTIETNANNLTRSMGLY